jgi:hypothetical protein
MKGKPKNKLKNQRIKNKKSTICLSNKLKILKNCPSHSKSKRKLTINSKGRNEKAFH